jgi:exodeoxyribonuclease-5
LLLLKRCTMQIEPSEEQAEAIKAIKEWYKHFDHYYVSDYATLEEAGSSNEFLLDGGAGTGKTTTAALAAEAVGAKCVVYGAYTAKAARVMQSKGMEGASTLHRLLYRPQFDKNGQIIGWTKDEQSLCRRADLIVVDEVSMVNDRMADDLRDFEKPILVLGDVGGQLPPIEGAGAFTRRRPDFTLREVHRTVADSPIFALAWRARRASFLPRGGPPEAHVAALNADAWERILNRDFQVICGKNSTRRTVTRRAREAFGFSGPLPQPGEPLICCRNNYNQGLINGDIAIMWRVTENDPDDDYFTADLLIDGETRTDVKINRLHIAATINDGKYPNNEAFDQTFRGKTALFDWAYAITCHKAQGSEFDHVVVIDDLFAQWDKDLRRRWLYTALTRARESVTVYQTG